MNMNTVKYQKLKHHCISHSIIRHLHSCGVTPPSEPPYSMQSVMASQIIYHINA